MTKEVDARKESVWTYCSTCEAMKPLVHNCGEDTLSVSDVDTETIDYYSVEAHLRGYHGEHNRRRAIRAIKHRLVDRSKTKTTEMKSHWL